MVGEMQFSMGKWCFLVENAVFHGEMLFSKGKLCFPWGKAVFHEEKLFSRGKCCFPKGNAVFYGEMLFSIRKGCFPWGKAVFQGEMLFSRGKCCFPGGNAIFKGETRSKLYSLGEGNNNKAFILPFPLPQETGGSRGMVVKVGRRKELKSKKKMRKLKIGAKEGIQRGTVRFQLNSAI